MTQEQDVDAAVERFSKAIVAMDIAQIMNDLQGEPMMKLQQQAGGGMAMSISGYEVLDHKPEGDDYIYDVKYIGPESFTVRARWSLVGSEWKIVDADIIGRA